MYFCTSYWNGAFLGDMLIFRGVGLAILEDFSHFPGAVCYSPHHWEVWGMAILGFTVFFSHGISLTKSSKITKCWEGELDWFFGEAIEENGTTLRYSNIAMENGPFEDGFPIKHRDIPLLC